ncbi:MAG TPA: FAD-binding protein [Candidatus Poseidoniaceae archaeon]|nr:FAD-binding protein [Candidatus Poseidoniaceae archaeon]
MPLIADGGMGAMNGIACHIQEESNRGHREDTIKMGAFLCDQDIVASRTTKALRIVDLLERRGVNFRRDAKGIVMGHYASGHSKPRLCNAGDATTREIQQVLEEQCMKYGVTRRSDQVPLELIHTDSSINGLIAIDMLNGRIQSIQCKALIVADGGFEGAFTNGSTSLGMDAAYRAGAPLRNMEFVAETPLGVVGTNLVIPQAILSDGATLHTPSGTALETSSTTPTSEICAKMHEAGTTVLDARNMGKHADWWAVLFDNIKQRTGIDMNRQTVGVAPVPSQTLGGLPTDEHGRVVLQSWARWFTGLYSAGSAASSGLHGADVLQGNRLLDSIAGGEAAGAHAAEWIIKRKFTGATKLEETFSLAEAELSMLGGESEESVQRLNPVITRLKEILTAVQTPATIATDYENAVESLEQLSVQSEQLYCDQTSLIANQNLLEILRTQAAIRMAQAHVQSASLRTESRGLHQRSDFSETDQEQLHHNLIFHDGTHSTLALRKGPSGNWILPPSAAV